MSAKKPALGEQLFKAVQATQGYSYISDAIENWPKRRVLTVAKVSLHSTQETAKILRRFIKKHSTK